jgi:hypothetical protein
MTFLLLCLVLLLGACSFKKNNQSIKGHEELYSEPNKLSPKTLSPDEKRVIIVATNDLQGKTNPQKISFKDDFNPIDQAVLIGGDKVMGAYFNILRKNYQHMILVDSGNFLSTDHELSRIGAFYEKLNYDALTVGLNDFNLKVPHKMDSSVSLFKDFAKNSKVPLLLSNLYDLKSARHVEWDGTKSYLLKELDGIKFGIIGLIPDDIPNLTPVNNRVGLYVESMLQGTLKNGRLLRSLGADIIVVLTNQGLDCHSKLMESLKLPASKVNFDPEKKNICDTKNILGEYLQRLPPGLVDVVVGGRTQEKMANFINGIAVMSGYPDGQSFSYTELVVNEKTRKLNAEKTVIHQPVLFCHEFFKETNDCFSDDKSINHLNRTPAKFLGEPISPDNDSKPWTKENLQSFDLSNKLIDLEADLSYHPKSTGKTQLFILKIKGKDLLKLLEEDYNRGRANDWHPSPFLKVNQEIRISISGVDLELDKTYQILSDLESSQKNHFFAKKVSSYDIISFPTQSWRNGESDSVTTRMAAPLTQRQ